jgi:hypothetical protein
MAPVKFAGRTYLIEFTVCVALYTIFVVARPSLLALTHDQSLDFAIKVLPIIPIWLVLLVIVRHYRRIDELERLKLLENVAIAAGITACLTTSYSLLEDVGLPKLAITWAWPTLATCWGVATGISALRSR